VINGAFFTVLFDSSSKVNERSDFNQYFSTFTDSEFAEKSLGNLHLIVSLLISISSLSSSF
jgi:hypothetical protein